MPTIRAKNIHNNVMRLKINRVQRAGERPADINQVDGMEQL